MRQQGGQYYNKSFVENCSNKLIVAFVWLLIFSIATAFYALYLPTLLQFNKAAFIAIVLIFSIIFILLVISYARATCTEPGSPGYELTKIYQQRNQLEYMKQMTEQRHYKRRVRRQNRRNRISNPQQLKEQIQQLRTNQFCPKCNIVRPPRAHHCSVCHRCILRMDHHCPWTGNCIGQYNHKYFILFLLYSTIGLAIVGITILVDWIKGGGVLELFGEDWRRYILIAAAIGSLVLMTSIGFLLFTQLTTAMINLTTLQSFTPGIEDNCPFDKGSVSENYKDIFGYKGCKLLPTEPLFRFQGYQYQIQHNF